MMSQADTISIVIPTYNMAPYLRALWDSILASGVLDQVIEVIFVDDGSSDASVFEVGLLKAGPRGELIEILALQQNQGRFLARLRGAERARGSRILFIDSRITLPTDFGAALGRLRKQYASLCVCVDIDVSRSVYCLYWDRSHRAIFRRHYRDTQQPLELNSENFDQYLSGTTTLLCSRELFLKICKPLENTPLMSDDNAVLKEMVREEPIVVHPEFRINWLPRESAWDFLKHLWARGPSFVEYHVVQRRQGPFFWVSILGAFATLAWILALFVYPQHALGVLAGFIGAVGVSVLVFTRNPLEVLKLLPLHCAVVMVFGVGILRGLVIHSFSPWTRKNA